MDKVQKNNFHILIHYHQKPSDFEEIFMMQRNLFTAVCMGPIILNTISEKNLYAGNQILSSNVISIIYMKTNH
jgi:hypothetical protein